MAALLPLPDLSLKQCQRVVQSCAGKGGFSRAIRPKKEYIKSCETCFANTLNLNDKGPSLKWVCFPKSYSPLANWLWLRIIPQSSLFVIYCLIPIANDWWALPVFLCKLNPIKAHWGKGSWPFSFERSRHLSSPSRSGFGRLILIRGCWRGRGACGQSPHHRYLGSKDKLMFGSRSLVDARIHEVTKRRNCKTDHLNTK